MRFWIRLFRIILSKNIYLNINFSGTVQEINSQTIFVELNNGVSFEVFVILPNSFKANTKIKLFCYAYLKEENQAIYGFKEKEYLDLFKLLNEVNGIGPKTALQILKNIDIDRLVYYISNGKKEELSKINGIGNKSDRLVAELKTKIKKFQYKDFLYEDVFNALMSLGYNSSRIMKVLSSLQKDLSDSEVMRIAILKLKDE